MSGVFTSHVNHERAQRAMNRTFSQALKHALKHRENTMPEEVDLIEILKERGTRYGPFINQAHIAQQMKKVIRDGLAVNATFQNFGDARKAVIEEGLEMIAHKIARLVNGQPDDEDSWVDISGYASVTNRDLRKGDDHDVE
jgi:hypothetical protein